MELSPKRSILKALRENPELLIDTLKRRGEDPSIVYEAIELDKTVRELRKKLDALRAERNKLNKMISKSVGEEKHKLIAKARELSKRINELENELERVKRRLLYILLSLPNILHPDVPVGKDENDNKPIRFRGKAKVYRPYLDEFLKQSEGRMEYEIIDRKPMGHADRTEYTGTADTIRAAKVAGSRFYYLLGDLVRLDLALILYAMDRLTRKGFRPVIPPYMLRHNIYAGVTSVDVFRDALYKIEDEDLYLIATSEHPLVGMFADEVIEKDELPILLLGVSPCFRKEAGSHGKDTKGIFRVHQFHKVEQIVFSLPEESRERHERLIRNAEELFQGLGLPYRVVDICTGDLGPVAARKYDLEVRMPAQGRFREMVSCSNVTDRQSFRLNIRYAEKRGHQTLGFVHTLNSTAIATSRAITAIIENYQDEEGVVEIPKALRPYLEPFPTAPKEYIRPIKKKLRPGAPEPGEIRVERRFYMDSDKKCVLFDIALFLVFRAMGALIIHFVLYGNPDVRSMVSQQPLNIFVVIVEVLYFLSLGKEPITILYRTLFSLILFGVALKEK